MTDVVIKRKSKAELFFAKLKEYLVQIPKEHSGFMKQTFMLAKEDLIKTYKGAVIGPLWALMKPLFQLFVYWFAFSILRGDSNKKEMGMDYFLFLMSGFVAWFFMSEMISRGSKSIADNRQFVNKVSFPVSVIMTYTSLSKYYVHIFLLSLCYLYITLAGGITLGLGAVVLLIGVLRVIFRRGRISGEDSTKYPPVAAVAAGAVGSGNSPYPAYSSGKTFDTYSAPPESLTENSGAYTGYYNAPVDNSAYNTDTTSFGAAPPSDPYNTQGGYNASSPYGAQPAAAPYNTQGGSVGGNTGFAGGGNASPSNNFGIRPDADPFAVQSGSVGGTGFADGGNTSSPNNFGIRPDADPFEGQGGYNGGNTDGGYGSSLYGIRPDADPFAGQSGFNSDQPDNF